MQGEVVILQHPDGIFFAANHPEGSRYPALARRVVALIGRALLGLGRRREQIAAERLPRPIDLAVLNPLVRALARMKAVAEARTLNDVVVFHGDRLKEGRAVA